MVRASIPADPDGTERLPTVSVVIPCRGHEAELVRCLESLEGGGPNPPHETVVVDSGPDPGIVALGEPYPNVRVVHSGTPLLPGEARNLGVSRSSGELVVFLDADCVVEPGWMEAATETLRGDPSLRMVGGPVLDARPLHPIAASDNLLQFSDVPAGRPAGPATYFPSCNMAVRRSAFLEVGGFQDRGILSGEDTTLCEAFRERWPGGLRFVPGMRVRHDGRDTLVEFLRHQARFGYARGARGLHITPLQRRLSGLAVLVPATAAKRFGYLTRRNFAWDFPRALRMLGLLPLLAAGLLAWSVGFRRGCRRPLADDGPGRDAARFEPSNDPVRP